MVTRIKISDPALKTAEGIRVGSSMADLRSTYEIAHIGYGEGSSFAIVESLAASFELDQSRIELSQVTDPNEVPDNVRIVRILLWLR